MAPRVYLISGTGRGLGLGFVQVLAKRDNVLVFAGARKPSRELESLAEQYPNKVHIVKLTSGSKLDNQAAVAEVKRIAGRLDIVIANAAMGVITGPVLETSVESMADHFAVNTIGPLVLFQAAYPLLKESTPSPIFLPVSSIGGSIQLGASMGIGSLAYGASKAALNYLARKLRADHEGLVCFPICPGVVDTDMLHDSFASGNVIPPEIITKSPEQTAEHLLARIDEAARETDVFKQWDGAVLPW